MSDDECTPNDCMCGPYDDPYENYWYNHTLNPAQQYFWWIQEWKAQFRAIHEDCKKFGLSSYSDDYVQGILDATPPDYYSRKNKFYDDGSSEFDPPAFTSDPELQKIDNSVDQWMAENLGT